MSAAANGTGAPDRRSIAVPRDVRGADDARVRVAIVGATGYVGAELLADIETELGRFGEAMRAPGAAS